MQVNILIVDDSSIMRTMIAKTVKMAGFESGIFHEAANGRQALECLAENWIDLVVTDINMPGMDGVTFITKMMEDDVLKHTPVIVVSTDGSETRTARLLEMGVKAFIRKPFTPESIRAVIQDVLKIESEA